MGLEENRKHWSLWVFLKPKSQTLALHHVKPDHKTMHRQITPEIITFLQKNVNLFNYNLWVTLKASSSVRSSPM